MGIDLVLSFLNFALEHAVYWRPWKWFWLIIGITSGICSVFCYFFYPDNPATCRFFTIEERIHIIRRVKKATKSSIEQKTFKYYQFVECLKDPITWMFMFFTLGFMLANATTYQSSNLYTELGFSRLETTLVMALQNFISICYGLSGSIVMYFFKSQSTYVGILYSIPACAGAIIAASISYNNKIGMLGGIYMTRANGTIFIIGLGLCTATAGGYTKRLTRTLLFMIFYSVANMIAPQLWQPKDWPLWRLLLKLLAMVKMKENLDLLILLMNKVMLSSKKWRFLC
ncbi:unnamed protein product [Ambrosiozyma monospora]|uniref:Unnamed protein product n=1 Tax=Ambrosiozyma monospora TaxID=43982 RepID=A0ACB5UCA6_AMBMO|nr:unnamed protein product [Ambrosiozyma monospora]